jgi:Ca2+/Na+ antiporter
MTEQPKQEETEEETGAQQNEESDDSWWGSKVKEFFRDNPTLVLSLLYLYVTAMGLPYSAALYARFGINILDYSEISDFLLAAFKYPLVFLWTGLTGFLLFAYLGYEAAALKTQARRNKRLYEDSVRSNHQGDERLTPQQQHLRFTGLRLDILVKAIAFAIFLVLSSLVVTYVSATSSASSIQDGETAAVDVRYKSFSGSAGQVTERAAWSDGIITRLSNIPVSFKAT